MDNNGFIYTPASSLSLPFSYTPPHSNPYTPSHPHASSPAKMSPALTGASGRIVGICSELLVRACRHLSSSSVPMSSCYVDPSLLQALPGVHPPPSWGDEHIIRPPFQKCVSYPAGGKNCGHSCGRKISIFSFLFI